MSNSWRTKADVLKDLGEVNGRRTGAEHLDQHVVAGERPPPIHHEAPDADEMSYFFGHGATATGDSADPDLGGISVMLKMVNDMDDTVYHEPITLYRNGVTDEISISKLNPRAGEYVPGTTRYNTKNGPSRTSPKKGNIRSEKNGATLNKHVEVSDAIPNGVTKNVLPVYSNMFRSKSDKVTTNGNKEATVIENRTPDANEHVQPKPEATQKTLINGLPKRKIQKPAIDSCNVATSVIKDIQEKIKSTVIASSVDNSLATKREKNVAIATLLKMGMLPKAEPVKLIKPDYFETLPSKEHDSESVSHKEVTKTSSESIAAENYMDQDSISKVNGWFNSMESPKPKLLPQEPLTLKEDASLITFKKKTNSSVTSKSDTVTVDSVKENKKEPAKVIEVREVKAFKPSAYAMDLLKQYERNAQRVVTLTEDLGSRLERQLKERDEVIRQKVARQNAG